MKFSLASIALLQISGVLAQYWSPPSAAITTGNPSYIHVYAVDPEGAIREWWWDGVAWSGPSYIGASARIGTTVTAVNDGSRVRVYYQNPTGGISERVHDNGWVDGVALP